MSAASSTNLPRLHDRYEIEARLGEGRLATVYRAKDVRLQRTVLVHILRSELAQQPNLRRRFEEEAQRGAQRSHPGLLEVYDSGEVGGRPYMVTEDISAGRPLAESGLLSAGEALSVVRTIVSAVALAQAQGVPHPPVSSRNVWLLEGGRTVLLENWNVAPTDVTRDLAPYRAPERAQGAPPSPATSVYALGILAWETFVGRRPFDAPTPALVAQQQLQRELPPISQERPSIFSRELDRIVGQAVAVSPNLRYPTPTDFGRALDLYADATSAQTGRLAALPYPLETPEPEPLAVQPPRSSRLPLPSRRSKAAVAPTVAPPPPPPVIQETPQTRTIVTTPAYDQRVVDQQIRREVKREVRRQGCRRAIIKRSVQLIVVFLLLYGGYLGIQYAVDYATGQIQQINPVAWITRQLPNPADLLPGWLRSPGSLTATYRVTQIVNLRSEPAVNDSTFIKQLEPGTLIQQVGAPQADANGQPYQWIQVIVLSDGSRGWVANQEGRLERQ